MTMLLAGLIAIAVPLLFLYIVRQLDLYASGNFTAVAVCFVGGLCAFGGAAAVNTALLQQQIVTFTLLATFAAPIVEELLKSAPLIYYVRRKDFTYFVDGAIYGFASGSAFAIAENLLYLSHSPDSLTLAISRVFSTSLMHSGASALVGVSLGRARFGHGVTRFLSVPAGWLLAFTLHASFNNLVNGISDSYVLLLAVAVGMSAVGITVGFIFWGLHEERVWLQQTLGLNLGVSVGESAMVQRMEDMDTLLAPVGERFGQEKRKNVETFLRKQALLGLKTKAAEMTSDGNLRQEMEGEVAVLRTEVDSLRRAVGVYCMSYVRSILPPETTPMWERLGQTLTVEREGATGGIWGAAGQRAEAAEQRAEAVALGEDAAPAESDAAEEVRPAPSGGLWGSLGARMKAPEKDASDT
ncbi:MAG: PrsW family glutamic-type intramembrane protease [Chloroflexi bacterium]|nr:PrsW family glutamic-type intramembrane protease [Chloroflexota bacterium]